MSKKPSRVIALSKIVALVMVNKFVKFHNISFNSVEVMTKNKVFHDNHGYADSDTRVMTIPRPFSSKDRRAKHPSLIETISNNTE